MRQYQQISWTSWTNIRNLRRSNVYDEKAIEETPTKKHRPNHRNEMPNHTQFSNTFLFLFLFLSFDFICRNTVKAIVKEVQKETKGLN